jgi:UDP-N-acetylglucosamine--N-acetylmuramyl-(pentapeptide) pyrophosphoryl-undecaprenol N-acetylglucosamine transferase
LRVVHQTGERDYNDVQAAYSNAGIQAEVSAFIDNMPQAFAGADLLVCRSGASTVAEVTAAGKPAIFVPFPQAADDHQRRNAEVIAQGGAAMLIPQSDLTPERLADVMLELMSDRGRLQQMSERARALSHHDAAGRVARMVAELAEKNQSAVSNQHSAE